MSAGERILYRKICNALKFQVLLSWERPHFGLSEYKVVFVICNFQVPILQN